MLLAKDKNPYPFTYIVSLGSNDYLIFLRCEATSVCYTPNLDSITIVKIILSSISNGLLFYYGLLLVYYDSLYSELNIFKKISFVGETFNKLPNSLFRTNVYNTL